MPQSALEYYNLIMGRVCCVLEQRINGVFTYGVAEDNKGYLISVSNEPFFIAFDFKILYTDMESYGQESNRCVLHIADRFISEYKNYIERTIVYRENSI